MSATAHPQNNATTPGVDQFAHFKVYRLPDGSLDSLGAGAMGITYRARDTLLERDVALKVIKKEFMFDHLLRARFFREAKAAAQLQHPNVAGVVYYGEEARICFYAMELVPGENVDIYVRRIGALKPRHALVLAHQIALALDAAYQVHLLHRDLKPANIMLANYHDRRDPHAKVIDFGLAKFYLDEPGSEFTRMGLLGTPGFASPEQWQGEKMDQRSDIYSLGATLWFMLSGKAPFEGSTELISEEQRFAGPELPGLEKLPLELQHLLMRLLAASPNDRPSTPLEVADHLQGLLDQLESGAVPDVTPFPSTVSPTAAPTPSPSERRRKSRFLLQPKLAAAIFSLVLAITAGLFLLSARRSSGENEAGKGNTNSASTAPFPNSLGMLFISIPGMQGQVSIYETRVKDFAAFIKETGDPGAANLPKDYVKWDQPGFPQTPDDPVTQVSADDAERFCRWLTQKERDANVITTKQSYRLPTREEFLKYSTDSHTGEFFWGNTWPPPNGIGNFADLETKKAQPTFRTIEDYRDGYPGTSPVGSFAPNSWGLFDVMGNVWEITRNPYNNNTQAETSMDGGAWTSFEPSQFRPGIRYPIAATPYLHDVGFRCMLVTE